MSVFDFLFLGIFAYLSDTKALNLGYLGHVCLGVRVLSQGCLYAQYLEIHFYINLLKLFIMLL